MRTILVRKNDPRQFPVRTWPKQWNVDGMNVEYHFPAENESPVECLVRMNEGRRCGPFKLITEN